MGKIVRPKDAIGKKIRYTGWDKSDWPETYFVVEYYSEYEHFISGAGQVLELATRYRWTDEFDLAEGNYWYEVS